MAYDFVQASNGTIGGQLYETNRQVYQGAVGANPLSSRQTCYNGGAQPCTTSSFANPITQVEIYDTLNGMQQRGSTAKFNSFGLQTERDDYDFGGSGARGALMRKEVWTYPTSGIVSLVSSDVVTDGAGNQVSQTTYGYDETTGAGHAALVATSSLPQHAGTIGSQRGNVTTVTLVNNVGPNLTTTYSYEDTGNPLTVTTPNGPSILAYDGATHAFAITVTPPTPSSGVALPNSATNNVAAGVPLTATDPNGQVTTYRSYDSMLRPTEIDNPDGGKTTVYYWGVGVTGVPGSSQIGVVRDQSPTAQADNGTLYDGYGRVSRQAVLNGQSTNPWYLRDTCYDANGTVRFTSYASQGSAWSTPAVCSGAGDSYTYDALGRTKTITHGDGTSISYTYQGRATQTTDENGVSKISQVDGLGRPTAVCEISSNASMPSSGSPVTCGLDIVGTGFATTYAYDLANHKTTVTQGVQTRVVQTDSLGRTISTTEPERGVTTYSYAYNATGLVVTRKRPKANQASASVLTTTTTQYDSMGRTVGITYDDSLTPNKQYDYDKVNSLMQWTQSPGMLKGRLADMASGSGAGLTRGLFSYDPMGRVLTMWQCTPSICGTAAQSGRPALQFAYDWTGNLTSEFDGASGQIAYSRSLAGEVTSINNQSYTDIYNTPSLVSSVVNGPNGPMTYHMGNGLNAVRSYDSMGRNTGGWICNGSSLQNCSGGTQIYGYTLSVKGDRVPGNCDTASNECRSFGYDEFDRLASMSGSKNYTYTYDRYGNRWAQNAPQGGSSFSASFDTTTNRINTAGYAYDAAGNMTNDGSHTYTFDAEGNVLTVDAGSTAQYVYDPLNRRVRVQTAASTYEYLFDYAGRRISSWLDPTPGNAGQGNEGRIYWGGTQLAFRAQNGQTFFDHQNYMATERTRTNYAGALANTENSLPFGDGYTETVVLPYSDQDNLHFASLDQDVNGSNAPIAEHAQFREYSFMQGRWLSPDPYDGSYDPSNPQSMNRYAYVLNSPLSRTDPSGLCDVILGGITQTPNTAGSKTQQNFANSINAISAFPYSGGTITGGIAEVGAQGDGPTQATQVAEIALLAAAADPGPINVFTWSGGAQAFIAAMAEHPELSGRINNITYLSPGIADNAILYQGNGATTALLGNGTIDYAVTFSATSSLFNLGVNFGRTGCGHDANCAFGRNLNLLRTNAGNPCSSLVPKVIDRHTGVIGGISGASGLASSVYWSTYDSWETYSATWRILPQ